MANRKLRTYPIDLTMPILVFIGNEPDGAEPIRFEDAKGEGKQTSCKLVSNEDAEVENSAQSKENAKDIPIPGVRLLPKTNDNNILVEFALPSTSYIKYVDKTESDWEKTVEYELDSEDEKFLTDLNKNMKNQLTQENLNTLRDSLQPESETSHNVEEKPRKQYLLSVDEDTFELIIDHLEKQSFHQREFRQIIWNESGTFKNTQQSLRQQSNDNINNLQNDNDDVPCCVCNEGDQEEGNLIVFCDGCNIAVHQVCIGLSVIPETSWFCDKCVYMAEQKRLTNTQSSPTRNEVEYSIRCMMCSTAEGAMKRTSCGQWIHVVCSLWIPELYFSSDLKVVKTDRLPPDRMKLRCEICGQRGGCVQCSERRCYTAYHATCAQKNLKRYVMKVTENKKTQQLSYISFCQRHSIIYRNQEIQKAATDTKTEVPVQIGRFIDKNTRKEIERKLQRKIPKDIFNSICEYWKAKRYALQKGRRPLIRRLQLLVEETNAEKQQNSLAKSRQLILKLLQKWTNEDKFKQMVALRVHMEKLRLLVDRCRKREQMKLAYLKTLRTLVDHLTSEGTTTWHSLTKSTHSEANLTSNAGLSVNNKRRAKIELASASAQTEEAINISIETKTKTENASQLFAYRKRLSSAAESQQPSKRLKSGPSEKKHIPNGRHNSPKDMSGQRQLTFYFSSS